MLKNEIKDLELKTSDLLTDSPFDDSGPFETQLPTGDQTLKIATEPAQEDTVPLTITLHGFSLWMSDQSSGFTDFPGE